MKSESQLGKETPPLVYDIGLHNGGDTRNYLNEGCRVVAIEANPAMCSAAAAEFRPYIDRHLLTILNCAVAVEAGKLEFWVCDSLSEWSSSDRALAARNGSKHHSVTVDCFPIRDIVGRFGVPQYMKIDIEGSDKTCLSGLTEDICPPYISTELDFDGGDRQIVRLHELGYRRFKLICQSSKWNQVTKRNLWFYGAGPDAAFVPTVQILQSVIRRINGRRRILRGRQRGESGPWGERSHGSWRSLEYVLEVWESICKIQNETGANGPGWWFDIHAKR
jgi:FkbM family methyltransferase